MNKKNLEVYIQEGIFTTTDIKKKQKRALDM